MKRKRRAVVRLVTMRLPYEDASKGIVARDVVIHSVNGNDETGDGSYDRPLRTKRGIDKLIKRMTCAHEAREREELEARIKADREAAEKEASERFRVQEAERKAKADERAAKEKELDEKILQLAVELNSLEKTLIESTHLFEMAQLDLIFGPNTTNLTAARSMARQIHYLRMSIMQRTFEHDALVDEQNKLTGWSKYTHWLLGGIAGYAMLGIAAAYLFRGEWKKP